MYAKKRGLVFFKEGNGDRGEPKRVVGDTSTRKLWSSPRNGIMPLPPGKIPCLYGRKAKRSLKEKRSLAGGK